MIEVIVAFLILVFFAWVASWVIRLFGLPKE
jgi:small neutral amino acid transporter SnatA (MarC family)